MKNDELNNDIENSVEKECLGDGIITKFYDPSKIKIDSQIVNLGTIIEMLQFKEIDLMPDFQRERDLWNRKKKSQLIESILLGLPLPSFYFSEYKDNDKPEKEFKWVVVDGLQRLSTFQEFIINENSFALEGLEFLSDYEGKIYENLSREDKRKISGFKVNLYVIEKVTPKDVKFLIFKRVNTGGLVLTPQEMRNALNQGVPSIFIKKLAENTKEFKIATSNKLSSKRQEDRDFVNRFVAFYLLGYEENYYGELDSFLNDAMMVLNNKSQLELDEIEKAFKKSMQLAYDIFENDAFRKRYIIGDKRKPISKAVFDCISVNLAWLTDDESKKLKENKEEFKKVLIEYFNKTNEAFHKSITTATAQKTNVKTRFDIVKSIIKELIYTNNIK